MKPKIIFFGSDKYSQIVFKALEKDSRFQIVKMEEKPDVGVIASYGKILTPEILALPQHGVLNIHPSLLPKYRGSSPVQAAILNSDKATGVTIIKTDEKVDHGPIVAQFKEEIKADDTAESLYNRLFTLGAEVLKTILPTYLEGKIELREQNHSQATYTKKLTRDDGKIDWKKPDDYLERFIRAMHPWPGAWTEVNLAPTIQDRKAKPILDRKRLKILKAYLEKGKLILDQIQLEGKKPVTWKQFQEGYPKAKIVS